MASLAPLHHLLGKILRQNTIHKYSIFLTKLASSFHFQVVFFGNKNVVKQGFNASWFDSHMWLHYDESKDLTFCFLCMKAVKKNTLITSRCADKVFTSTGFSSWKDAEVAFRNHEQIKCHKEAVQTVVCSFAQRL